MRKSDFNRMKKTPSDKFLDSLNLTETACFVLLAANLFLTESDPQKYNKTEMIETINVVLNEAHRAGVFNKLIETGLINFNPTIH